MLYCILCMTIRILFVRVQMHRLLYIIHSYPIYNAYYAYYAYDHILHIMHYLLYMIVYMHIAYGYIVVQRFRFMTVRASQSRAWPSGDPGASWGGRGIPVQGMAVRQKTRAKNEKRRKSEKIDDIGSIIFQTINHKVAVIGLPSRIQRFYFSHRKK